MSFVAKRYCMASLDLSVTCGPPLGYFYGSFVSFLKFPFYCKCKQKSMDNTVFPFSHRRKSYGKNIGEGEQITVIFCVSYLFKHFNHQMHKIKSKVLWVNPNLESFMDLTSTPAPPHVHQPLFTACVVFTHALALVCVCQGRGRRWNDRS